MANGTLKVSNIQTSSGSGTITLGQSGETITIPSGATQTGIGKIGQIVQDQVFSSFTVASTSTYGDSGVSCVITPTSSSSKILIHAGLGEPDQLDGRIMCDVFRGTDNLGDTANYSDRRGRLCSEFGRNLGYSGTEDHFFTISKTFIDEPATTSQLTYTLKCICTTSGTIRMGNGSAHYIIAMEILS